MRNNLIVKGIQEVEDENRSDTTDIVAASFSQLLDIPKQTVYEGIERAHHGGTNLAKSFHKLNIQRKTKVKTYTPIFLKGLQKGL